MDLTIPFLAVSAAAIYANFLDWDSTVALIAKHGIAGESNPIMRFVMGKSKWLGLAYKAIAPACFLTGGFAVGGGDVQNFLVKYGDANGTDHWAIAWFACALVYGGVGLYGYLHNKNQK